MSASAKTKSRLILQQEKTILRKIETGRPVDYSFKNLRSLKLVPLDGLRESRVGRPELNPVSKKFLSKSIWFNNNKLKRIKNLENLVESILDRPQLLGWLDFSFNFITGIDSCILSFPNLKILYFHGNCIEDINELFKLRELKHLRSVTFHGNPISNLDIYRNYVIQLLPQLMNLDFAPVVDGERTQPPPVELVRKIREEDKGGVHGK